MAKPSNEQKTVKEKGPAPPENQVNVLTLGSRGKRVRDLQNNLKALGFDVGYIDGIYGPRTVEEVKNFQAFAGLEPDGIFGPDSDLQLQLLLALNNSDQPLPDPHDAEGNPMLLDVISVIGTLKNPLERLRRLLEMMDRAEKYGDSEADQEARRFAFREAQTALSEDEWVRAAVKSRTVDELMRRFREQKDTRAETLWAMKEEAAKNLGEDAPDPIPPAQTLARATPKIATDIWEKEDKLGYAAYARALAALITHEETLPPLTIGIKAPWGAGKTSLMRMIQALLDGAPEHTGMSAGEENDDPGSMAVDGDWKTDVAFETLLETLDNPSAPTEKVRPKQSPVGDSFKIKPRVTVWFNAWKYQNSEQLWAGLAHCIVSQVTSRLSPVHRELFWLKLHARRVDVNKVRQNFYTLVCQEFLPRCVLWALGAALSLAASLVLPKLFSLAGIGGSAVLIAGMVVDWKSKLNSRLKGTVEGTFRDLIRSPSYEGKLGFLHMVESDLREVLKLVSSPTNPLVVFIDDLDRCAPPQVTQVVEAINLFLGGDYPNCIFVLGMEPEMVAAALDTSYKSMDDILKTSSAKNDRAPLGWRFMEKIIQLPLTIPPPVPANIDTYLDVLLRGEGDVPELPQQVPEQAIAEIESSLDEAENIADVESLTLEKMSTVQSEEEKAAVREAGMRVYTRKLASKDPLVRQFVKDSASCFDANPRQIKRYINLFRFYATLRYAYKLDGTYDDPATPMPTDAALAKFVALSIHWPQAIGWLWGKNDENQLILSQLEDKARELSESEKTTQKADASWASYLKASQLEQPWALETEFRYFLAKGEPLSPYQGCRLW